MKAILNRHMYWIFGICILFMASACENDDVNGQRSGPLVMLIDGAELDNTEYERWILEPVRKKYPDLAIELLRNSEGLKGLEYLIIKGQFPDLIMTGQYGILNHVQLQSAYELSSLIAEHQLDIGRYDETAMELIRTFGDGQSLYALPFSLDYGALFYNRELFEHLNVPYPEDGMTWEEVIERSQSFYLMNDERVYGLTAPGLDGMGSQMSLRYVNPETGWSDFHNDGWIRVVQLYNVMQGVLGNPGANASGFVEKRNVAMMAGYTRRIHELQQAYDKELTMDWDLVQYPSYPELPDTAIGLNGRFMVVSAISDRKEDAYRVIEAITDRDLQLALARSGIPSALGDPEMKTSFGVDLDILLDKNVSSLFKSVPAKPFVVTDYDMIALEELIEASKEMMTSDEDVNTIFRKAVDRTDRKIDTKNTGF